MKRLRLKSLIVAALALTYAACEKNLENVKNVSEVEAAAIPEVVYPLVGADTSNNILPKRELPNSVLTTNVNEDYEFAVQVFDTVCADYLNGTEKFDLSYLAEGSVTTRIMKTGNLISTDPDFSSGRFKKLSHGPNGWWTHWNYSPYTESESPVVLFALNRSGAELFPLNTMSINLRNPVKTFGFEIAPNTTGKDMELVVSYQFNGSYRHPNDFVVRQTISSPSGARLIAVKCNYAFTYVNIELHGDVPFRDKGFAIANIRLAY
ncbi:MAG: hypothetical protein JWQ28_2831 [Pedobacter sp.]|jgi:hypothetical protein|nr:hypothetical protein [Pedobacter sp.]